LVSSRSFDAAVFGYSHEGYLIAASLCRAGFGTVLIDDVLSLPIELKSDMVKAYRTIRAFKEAENLVGVLSLGATVERAKAIFFAPRIRHTGSEGKLDISRKLKDLTKSVSKGTLVVNNVPVGPGGNQQLIAEIERVSGLDTANDLHYTYAPLHPCSSEPIALGSQGDFPEDLESLLKAAFENPPGRVDIHSAELNHALLVTKAQSSYAVEVELAEMGRKSSREKSKQKFEGAFLDDSAAHIFDVKSILPELSSGEPLFQLTSGMLKSFDHQLKKILDTVKQVFKTMPFKAARTRVMLAWSLDEDEIRSSRLETLSLLEEKLKDFLADVVPVNTLKTGTKSDDSLFDEKSNVVLAFSQRDFDAMKSRLKNRDLKSLIIKVNPTLEIIEI
jgi:hypothetical protein